MSASDRFDEWCLRAVYAVMALALTGSGVLLWVTLRGVSCSAA